MLEVQQDAERRFAEIELFLGFLKALERLSRADPEALPTAKSSATTLKACTFLLLYNVIESCVRSAIGQAYAEIESDGLIFGDSTEEIKGIWLRQQLEVPTDSANHGTYLGRAIELAEQISSRRVLVLESRKLPISGNLDGDTIRKLCAKHGVTLRVTKWAKGGAELSTIKDQRNALAHGHKSFSECGRDYAVKDLERIFKQSKHFMRGFVRSVTSFNSSRGFRRA